MSAAIPDPDLERLKLVAGRFDDLFQLPMVDAPGFAFVGAKFHVDDAATGRRWDFSAGAADPDRQRAFRRCVGEAAETMAQFLCTRPSLSGHEGGVPGRRLHDDAEIIIPTDLCFRDAVGAPASGLSLGCAAGRTAEEATLSALCELVERDAMSLWWDGGARAVPIPLASLDRSVADMIARMRDGRSTRETWFLDLTSDVGLPVAAALSCTVDGYGLAAGFAARGTFDAACLAALNELAQMELGNALAAAKLERNGKEALVATELRQIERMTRLSASDMRLRGAEADRPIRSETQTVTQLAGRLADLGISCSVADLTDPAYGIPVVKVVAPLLQTPDGPETRRLAATRKSSGFTITGVSTIRII
ncbi:YcaO-like family protein [Mesorhizobium sp. CAU 1732]|uniref:YcaO-like family protein n=1 Tax=Mesorhizobium sp. CAU 1732 TaxID=3140358 RepID=UPI0032611668